MKLLSATAALLAVSSGPCSAFSPPRSWSSRPPTFGVISSPRGGNVAVRMSEGKVPFFASKEEREDAPPPASASASSSSSSSSSDDRDPDAMTIEEEVDMLVQQELKKSKLMSKLKTADGVDYAPWMGIDAEDEEEIRQIMKEKAEARRKRQEQEKTVSGNLYLDSQAQELSGTGLKGKVIDGEVELEWATKTERDTRGFVIKRRPAKTEGFSVVASYEEWGPLQSKGPDGGIYRYLDTNVAPGGWVYRVSEVDDAGTESDLCQCLVEVQTEDEQQAAKFAAIGIVAIGIAAVAAGLILDPYAG